MEHCDVVIVGGGPAGSACARRLVESGADVVVVDKQPFPRNKPCAGWITPQVVEEIELDSEEYARGHVFQPITAFRTGMIGRDEVETRYDKPVSYGIRRFEFDHYLLLRCGARLRLGEAVASLELSRDGWVVNGELAAPVLVGAGGHFCPVARELGRVRGERTSVVAAQEVEFEIPAEERGLVDVHPERPELFFCDDLQGYGWCFRKGDFLNVGLGRVDREGLSGHVAAFCDFLRERGKLGCKLPARFAGHAYQLYESAPPKLFDERVLLVGDAAGLAYPQSGEGILPAVVSAHLAADTILNTAGRYSAADLEPYAGRIEHRLGKPRAQSAADWLPAGWLRFIAARLLATSWFSRRVVLERWFLHLDEADRAADIALPASAH
jgi:geranylgeranyl reductase family protein